MQVIRRKRQDNHHSIEVERGERDRSKRNFFTRLRVGEIIKITGPCELFVADTGANSAELNFTMKREFEVIK